MSHQLVNNSFTIPASRNNLFVWLLILSGLFHIFLFLTWPASAPSAPRANTPIATVISVTHYTSPITEPLANAATQDTLNDTPSKNRAVPEKEITNTETTSETTQSDAATQQKETIESKKTVTQKIITSASTRENGSQRESSFEKTAQPQLAEKLSPTAENKSEDAPSQSNNSINTTQQTAEGIATLEVDESNSNMPEPPLSQTTETTEKNTTHLPPVDAADYQQAQFNGPTPRIEKPKEAKRKRWSGTVLLRALISETGELSHLTLYESSGYPLLDKTAMEAAQTWAYKPAVQGSTPIAHWVTIPVTFR